MVHGVLWKDNKLNYAVKELYFIGPFINLSSYL